MRIIRTVLATLLLSAACWGWNCPAGQIRQQAPPNTPTTTPYYDVVEGIAFICVPNPTTPTSPADPVTPITVTSTNSSTSNSNSSSSSNSSASANQSQKQKQKQTQSQVATGGQASSTSTAAGGNAIATGNGNNSNDTTVEAPKIPVSTAITPPIMPTVPCFKGFGGAAQTPLVGGSFGGGKVDPGCDDRELARSFSGPQTIASCKILVATKKAKKAGVTLDDCLNRVPRVSVVIPMPGIPDVHDMSRFPEPPSAPLLAPAYRTQVTVVAPKPKKSVVHLPPNCQNEVIRVCK